MTAEEDAPPPAALQLAYTTATALRGGWQAALGAGIPLALVGFAVAWETANLLGWLRDPFELYRWSWIEYEIQQHPLAHVAAIPAGVFAAVLVVAGPLAAFGRAALGHEPRALESARLGIFGSVRILPIHSFLALSFLVPFVIFQELKGHDASHFLVRFVPAFFLMCAAPYLAVRFFALATVALIVDPDPSWREATLRAVNLGRGQLALFSFAWLAPIALFTGALLGPAEHAKKLLFDAVGPSAGKPLVLAATVVAALVAVWLGCAIQAASYAVATKQAHRSP